MSLDKEIFRVLAYVGDEGLSVRKYPFMYITLVILSLTGSLMTMYMRM